ncbi:MAG: hypothetical protein ACFB11_06150 [Paracoccaceae bacterium]
MNLWARLSYPFRSRPRRPLAMRQPERQEGRNNQVVPLGMEATDLDMVDRVTRRNDALERVSSGWLVKNRPTERSSHVRAMPDDETYARRYFSMFKKKGTPE